MDVRKLKAAISNGVLAYGLCNAVTSTGPCGTPFRRWADSVLAQFPWAVVTHASTTASRCQRYSVPSAQIRCINTASLRATATAARRRPRRLAMPSPQTRMAEYFLDRVRSASADWYRTARIAASPHLEMPPFLSVSPEAYFFGVRPGERQRREIDGSGPDHRSLSERSRP
jgi:hypothetical protein